MMNLTSRSILLVILLISCVILLPALIGVSLIALPEEDNLAGDDFMLMSNLPLAWSRIPIHQMSILLRGAISIFALFVVFLGGRSKHKRFNDRTIDHVNILIAEFLKTAPIRAVFNFPFVAPHSNYPIYRFLNPFLPILIPNSRRH
jgi:hypothetical protein